MLNEILAHGGETHNSVAVEKAHELQWFIQVPLYTIAIAVFAGIVWLISKSVDATLLITSAVLLISGFAFFQIAPVVSVLAISFGLVLTLGVTLLGLGAGSKK